MARREIDTFEDIPQETKDEFVEGICLGLKTILGEEKAAKYTTAIHTNPLLKTPDAAANFAYGVILDNGKDLVEFLDATKLLEPSQEKE
jgi:hypothetical protein